MEISWVNYGSWPEEENLAVRRNSSCKKDRRNEKMNNEISEKIREDEKIMLLGLISIEWTLLCIIMD